jgi:hypothetical protein
VVLNSTNFTDCVASSASALDLALEGLLGPAGGGLALFNVTGALRGCVFARNAATTTDVVLLPNPDLPQARGGGLFVAGANVTVTASIFSENTAFYGGGVYAFDDSVVMLSGCALADNVAVTGDGGGVFAHHCVSVSVWDSLLSGNSAGGHTGGGVAAINTGIDFRATVLADNAAPHGCGGAVGADAGATVTMERGITMRGNTARDGGAACCNLCARMDIEDAFLFENIATHGSGGAVFTSSSPTVLVNVSAWANTAPAGGAVSAASSPLNMTDCVLHDNAATNTHGGAVLHDATDDHVEELLMTRCAVASNTCVAGGGGVAAFGSVRVAIAFCTFEHNTITSPTPAGAGVFALNVADLSLRNCTLDHNKVTLAPALADDAALGFVAGVNALGSGLGGGLWVGSNNATRGEVYGTLFVRNSGSSGGAVYVTGAAELAISASNFSHDHSTDWAGRGGGIVSDATSVLDVQDSYFYSCEANKGGAGWHGGASTATYTRCMFDENEGTEGEDMKGMALRVDDDAQLFVDASTFRGQFGPPLAEGTIAMSGSPISHLTVTDSLFDNNKAFLGSCFFIVRRLRLHLRRAHACTPRRGSRSASLRVPCVCLTASPSPAFAVGVLAGAPAERKRHHVQ